MTERFETIVIGLGAFGSATTYQLAKRGRSVLGIDQHSPPHNLGSTHGETRITRLACGEGAVYTASARRSHEIWRDLERQTGEQLLVQNGLLLISGPGQRASAHGNPDFLDSTIDAARRNDVTHELLNDTAIRKRFPQFNIADGERAYFEPEAGYLSPEKCVAAQLKLARDLGATIRTGEKMLRFTPRADGVEVTTDRGSYVADTVVLSAGPWLPQILPRRAPIFTVRRQVLAWFRIDQKKTSIDQFRPEAFPVFYWQVPRKQAIYGFPWVGGEPAIKLSTEQYDTQTSPEKVERTVSAEEIAAIHSGYVADFLPGIGSECIRTAVCMYTCVDDARFVVDRMPDNQRVIVASPCSGHGFKHSAALGEAIAEIVVEGAPSKVPLGAFHLPA